MNGPALDGQLETCQQETRTDQQDMVSSCLCQLPRIVRGILLPLLWAVLTLQLPRRQRVTDANLLLGGTRKRVTLGRFLGTIWAHGRVFWEGADSAADLIV